MRTVKTSELSGRALDYATGKADGRSISIGGGNFIVMSDDRGSGLYNPTGHDWHQCGVLLEKYMINVSFDHDEEYEPWSATSPLLMGEYFTGDNARVAICRAVVSMSKLGDTVEIPEEPLK